MKRTLRGTWTCRMSCLSPSPVHAPFPPSALCSSVVDYANQACFQLSGSRAVWLVGRPGMLFSLRPSLVMAPSLKARAKPSLFWVQESLLSPCPLGLRVVTVTLLGSPDFWFLFAGPTDLWINPSLNPPLNLMPWICLCLLLTLCWFTLKTRRHQPCEVGEGRTQPRQQRVHLWETYTCGDAVIL